MELWYPLKAIPGPLYIAKWNVKKHGVNTRCKFCRKVKNTLDDDFDWFFSVGGWVCKKCQKKYGFANKRKEAKELKEKIRKTREEKKEQKQREGLLRALGKSVQSINLK